MSRQRRGVLAASALLALVAIALPLSSSADSLAAVPASGDEAARVPLDAATQHLGDDEAGDPEAKASMLRLLGGGGHEEVDGPEMGGGWSAGSEAGHFEYNVPGLTLPARKAIQVEEAPAAKPLPWETEGWQKDIAELQELLDIDIEPEVSADQGAAGDLTGAGVAPDGQIESMGGLTTLMNLFSKTPDPMWPFCSPAGALWRVGLVCPVMKLMAKYVISGRGGGICLSSRILFHPCSSLALSYSPFPQKRILMRSPPDFEKLTTEHHCPNGPGPWAGMRLPAPLIELSEKQDGTPVPMVIPPELIAQEKATYGWYLTHVYNMYSFAFKYADDILTQDGQDHTHSLRPLTPSGWGNQNVYFVKDPQGWSWPIGQSLTKGELMVVFFCGTMFPGMCGFGERRGGLWGLGGGWGEDRGKACIRIA